MEELNKAFNDYKIIILKQSYPEKSISTEFMSDNINIPGYIFELKTTISTSTPSKEIWDELVWSSHGRENIEIGVFVIINSNIQFN